MRKYLLFLLLFAFGIQGVRAAGVDLATAQKAANGFAETAFQEGFRGQSLDLFMSTPDYYVFTAGAKGFVIISADDRFRPIIGYSEEDAFTSPLSPELAYYLNDMVEGRHLAMRSAFPQDPEVAEEWTRLLSGAPLPSRNGGRASFYLVQTRWDQGDPYNKFCPPFNGSNHSYAGCVATAMSQVMFYWKHPAHGYGNHSYVHQTYGELSADFSADVYNFDIMPLTLAGASQEGIDEVAYFMYHCGIAVDMSYSTSGSGAYSQDVPEAVMNYFDYSNACRHLRRDAYSLSDFQAILKDQFDTGWPCYYSGSDPNEGSGHAFVCDGYDDYDFFHFNWGWSGSGNGYYAIDALNVSGYAWNSDQAVITNFVPRTVFLNATRVPEAFTAVPNGDDQFSVSLSWVNPTTTLSGKPLDGIERMVVERDGVVVHTFDNATPGEAMSYVDVAGVPISVNYAVYAVCDGVSGRKATVNGVNLGPSCEWTVKMRSEREDGWGNGMLTILNSSGVAVANLSAERSEAVETIEVPEGWLTFLWTAPADSITLGFDILDAAEATVFTYDGPSTLMPKNIFYQVVNTCGGEGSKAGPTDLKASVVEGDVVLSWTGIADPGYGYIVYRDGYLYTMVQDTTCFVDANMAEELHNYYVTAFTKDGESDPSNTCSAVTADETLVPKNVVCEILENGRIKFSWEAPDNVEDQSGYRFYQKRTGEAYHVIKNLSTSQTSYTFSNSMETGYRYQYKLVSIYQQGKVESAPAVNTANPELRYFELNDTHLPSALTMEVGEENIQLQWASAMLAESYNVYRNGERIFEGLTEPNCVDDLEADRENRVYYVTGVLNGVESSPSNKVYYGNAAVDENNTQEITVYPNPSHGMLTVKAASLKGVEVYNLAGQKLFSGLADDAVMQVDLSGLPSGVYAIRVRTEQGNSLKKVVLIN